MATTETAPAPGVYRGLSMEDYHGWDAASNSRLSQMLRSPAHCRVAMLGEFKDTEALAFGRAAHCAVLEPDEFDKRYQVATQCLATTKQGKQCSKAGTVPLATGDSLCVVHAKMWDDDRSHKEIISQEDWQHCYGMRQAVHTIDRAHSMLDGLADVGVSVRWDDQETGVPCKARWDGHANIANGCILDYKTTIDARPAEFERSIFKFGYHRQGAMYLEAAAAHGIEAKHYVIIASEKVPPYGTAIYRLTEGAIDAGADQLRPLLRRYAECLESGEWPGYSTAVQDIGLPDWAWKQMEA